MSAGNCPICERQALKPITVQSVEIETCSRCGGLWFESGKLQRFPDRPSAKALLPLAQHAPGRCRRAGHPVAQALMRCATCGSPPAECPSCNLRLAMVLTPACAIDVCVRCEGVWLDAGEFEALRGMAGFATTSERRMPPSPGGWEIPAPSTPAKDPWLGPGQLQAPFKASEIPNVRAPFSCRQCGASLSVANAWAFDGEIYCEACRPPGAVSSRDLPTDSDAALEERGDGFGPSTRPGTRYPLLQLMFNMVTRKN